MYSWLKSMFDDFGKYPELANNFKFYEMTGEEQKHELWRKLKFLYEHPELGKKYFKNYDVFENKFFWYNYWWNSIPVGMGLTMFQLTVLNMGNEE